MADEPERSWRDDPKIVELTEEILRLHKHVQEEEREMRRAERLLEAGGVRPIEELVRDVEYDFDPPESIEELTAQTHAMVAGLRADVDELIARADELAPGQARELQQRLQALADRFANLANR
jgi:hypothetical protein